MSIRVNDFRWEPGKNDAEYIKLLESSRNEWQNLAQKAIAKLKALSKAQEPRLVTEADFENADPYGYLPVWVEDKDDTEIVCNCITKAALTDVDAVYTYRFWTSRPDEKRRTETPWEQ